MGQTEVPGSSGDPVSIASLPLIFIDLVAREGAVPLAIPNNPQGLAQLVPIISGLLIIGGDDLDPSLYTKEQRHPATQRNFPSRDATELKIVRAALRRGVPVLGICRGNQVLNVAQGGSLHQHLLDGITDRQHSQFGSKNPKRIVWHDVALVPGSQAAKIVGSRKLRVNSDHHQGIDKVGRKLKVTATSSDGVVEAIEGTDWPFVMGLQWHPERIAATHPVHGKFFRAFVRASRI